MNNELTWEDIRTIVIAADEVLEMHSKKELIEMGEEGYYSDVLSNYLNREMEGRI